MIEDVNTGADGGGFQRGVCVWGMAELREGTGWWGSAVEHTGPWDQEEVDNSACACSGWGGGAWQQQLQDGGRGATPKCPDLLASTLQSPATQRSLSGQRCPRSPCRVGHTTATSTGAPRNVVNVSQAGCDTHAVALPLGPLTVPPCNYNSHAQCYSPLPSPPLASLRLPATRDPTAPDPLAHM